jgi:hypothetical protein
MAETGSMCVTFACRHSKETRMVFQACDAFLRISKSVRARAKNNKIKIGFRKLFPFPSTPVIGDLVPMPSSLLSQSGALYRLLFSRHFRVTLSGERLKWA